MFTSYKLKHRPDQTVYDLNQISSLLQGMRRSIRIVSDDNKNVIIIGGGHPIDPNTGKPYSFGIRKYRIKGDKLELEHDYE